MSNIECRSKDEFNEGVKALNVEQMNVEFRSKDEFNEGVKALNIEQMNVEFRSKTHFDIHLFDIQRGFT